MENIPFELLQEIFVHVDGKCLYRLCVTCHSINNLINDDLFLINKIKKDFGIDPTKIKSEMKYSKRYMLLLKITSPDFACASGSIDSLLHFKNKNIFPSEYCMRIAFIKGHINIIEYLLENGFNKKITQKYPGLSQESINVKLIEKYSDLAIANNNIKLSEWIIEKGFSFTIHSANLAASNGHLDALIWLKTKLNILPDIGGLQFACARGHLNIIKWLISENIMPITSSMNLAIENNRIELIPLFISLGLLPSQKVINLIPINGTVEMLTMMIDRGINPRLKSNQLNKIIQAEKLDVLKVLYKIGIVPTNLSLFDYSGSRLQEMIEWVISINISLSQPQIDQIYLSGNKRAINILKSNKMYPDFFIYKSCRHVPDDLLSDIPKDSLFNNLKNLLIREIRENNCQCLMMLKNMNILIPETEIVDIFTKVGDSGQLKLLSHGIIPSQSIYDLDMLCVPTLNVLYQLNVLPPVNMSMDRYILYRRVNEIVWFNDKGIFLNQEKIDKLFGMLSSMDAEYLISNNIIPSKSYIKSARLKINCLKSLKDKGVIIPETTIINYKFGLYDDEIKWLISNIDISKNTIINLVLLAIEFDNVYLLDWLISSRIVEYDYIFYVSVINEKFRLISTLKNPCYTVSNKIIEKIMKYTNDNKNYSILDWLLKEEYIFMEKNNAKIRFYMIEKD